MALTSGAEGPVVGGVAAVAQVAVVLLHALAAVAAVHPVTGAVALAAGLDAGRHLGPLLQVQGDAVHPQGPDAAQEAPLAPCSALREGREGGRSNQLVGSSGGGSIDPSIGSSILELVYQY